MTDQKQSVSEHVEDVVHQLLGKMQREVNCEALAQLAQAVASLACWPQMNPLKPEDHAKLAEHDVAQALEKARLDLLGHDSMRALTRSR